MNDARPGAVMVTGAGSGIGRDMTRQLLDQGTPVAACDLNLGDLPTINNPDLSTFQLDTRDKGALADAVAQTIEERGSVAGLSACAGIFRPKPFFDISLQDFDDHFSINLKGVLFSCQAVLPHMIEQKRGSIVLWSSGLGRSPQPGTAQYAATKGGVLGLMRTLALEMAQHNIRVNAISPGIADTPMPHAVMPEGTMEARARANPMGRIGTAQDMANAAMFLLSDEASYTTGQDFRVNGGMNLF
ncbi:MAG: SDR family oxidoreductase [Hyphomicrobiales bacterium]|nr:SDR family oxidoreductase [Hyphomicrobiales bacterium]